jgi:hypothetical protein
MRDRAWLPGTGQLHPVVECWLQMPVKDAQSPFAPGGRPRAAGKYRFARYFLADWYRFQAIASPKSGSSVFLVMSVHSY